MQIRGRLTSCAIFSSRADRLRSRPFVPLPPPPPRARGGASEGIFLHGIRADKRAARRLFAYVPYLLILWVIASWVFLNSAGRDGVKLASQTADSTPLGEWKHARTRSMTCAKYAFSGNKIQYSILGRYWKESKQLCKLRREEFRGRGATLYTNADLRVK